MTRILILALFASTVLGVTGCGESPKGKSELPPNAKDNIGAPTVVGGGPQATDPKKGKASGVGAD
jgi:predicted small lipoprotein YifL